MSLQPVADLATAKLTVVTPVAIKRTEPRLLVSCCGQYFDEAQWKSLRWLQYSGMTRTTGVLHGVEVRECTCTRPVAREVVVPTAIVVDVAVTVGTPQVKL